MIGRVKFAWCTVITIVALICALPWLGLQAADKLLVVRTAPQNADVILVLGGETESRTAKAVELFQQGFAPKILVTGNNEGYYISERLVASGIPPSAVYVEPEAKSTFENATFCLPILRHLEVRRVLLVTSWFHSRRAIAVFRTISKDLDFISVPTETASIGQIISNLLLREQVLVEYVKIAGYLSRSWVKPDVLFGR